MRKDSDKVYSASMVRLAISERAGWDDAKFNSKFADTDGVNLLLVSGYMEGLGISQVTPTKINLTDGVLIDPFFWR